MRTPPANDAEVSNGEAKHHNSYTDQFKATAVALSNMLEIQTQDVAEALCIHPVMLYRWRMETRNGTLMARK